MGISVLFFVHFSPFLFFSCCGTRALHVLWRRFLCMEENRITCFFAAHTYLCAGKAMHWFSLCVQMKQGAMNPLCRNALFWVQNRARTIMCAPWEHASIVCGICKVCIGLLFVNHNQAKQKKSSKLQAAGWVMPPV